MEHLDSPERAIVESWHINAEPWTEALRLKNIVSRRLVTDGAIIDAVRSVRPRRVLDLGCGEGWLARTLCGIGIEVLGIDVVPALVATARRLGLGRFDVYSYQDIIDKRLAYELFDVAVCNFSLLGAESVESLLASLAHYLHALGYLVIQTLHPVVACGAGQYRDGWRPGSWAGFGPDFRDPPPWFFRTIASWYAMLRRCGFEVVECREPTAHGARAPSSLIFICSQRGASAGV